MENNSAVEPLRALQRLPVRKFPNDVITDHALAYTKTTEGAICISYNMISSQINPNDLYPQENYNAVKAKADAFGNVEWRTLANLLLSGGLEKFQGDLGVDFKKIDLNDNIQKHKITVKGKELEYTGVEIRDSFLAKAMEAAWHSKFPSTKAKTSPKDISKAEVEACTILVKDFYTQCFGSPEFVAYNASFSKQADSTVEHGYDEKQLADIMSRNTTEAVVSGEYLKSGITKILTYAAMGGRKRVDEHPKKSSDQNHDGFVHKLCFQQNGGFPAFPFLTQEDVDIAQAKEFLRQLQENKELNEHIRNCREQGKDVHFLAIDLLECAEGTHSKLFPMLIERLVDQAEKKPLAEIDFDQDIKKPIQAKLQEQILEAQAAERVQGHSEEAVPKVPPGLSQEYYDLITGFVKTKELPDSKVLNGLNAQDLLLEIVLNSMAPDSAKNLISKAEREQLIIALCEKSNTIEKALIESFLKSRTDRVYWEHEMWVTPSPVIDKVQPLASAAQEAAKEKARKLAEATARAKEVAEQRAAEERAQEEVRKRQKAQQLEQAQRKELEAKTAERAQEPTLGSAASSASASQVEGTTSSQASLGDGTEAAREAARLQAEMDRIREVEERRQKVRDKAYKPAQVAQVGSQRPSPATQTVRKPQRPAGLPPSPSPRSVSFQASQLGNEIPAVRGSHFSLTANKGSRYPAQEPLNIAGPQSNPKDSQLLEIMNELWKHQDKYLESKKPKKGEARQGLRFQGHRMTADVKKKIEQVEIRKST